MRSNVISPVVIKLIVLASFIVICAGLIWQAIILSNSVPFHDWDEAIYAQVAKEFVSHPGITLRYNGAYWFEKPPLLAWYYGLAWVLPFSHELGARLLSAFLSIGSLLMVYALSRKYFAGKLVSLLALLVCLQSAMFIDRSILVNVDMMLTFGWLLYLWGATSNKNIFRFFGLIVGVLSKSLLGFIPLVVEILLDIVSRRYTLRKLYFHSVCLAIGSIWYFVMLVLHGKIFLISHFYDHLISRVVRPIELHFGGRMFYVEKLWHETGIIMLVACIGMSIFLIRVIRRRKVGSISKLYVVAVALAYFLVLTLSKAKLHWYITPLIPLIGIGTASVFENIIHSRSLLLRFAAYASFIGLSLFCIVQFTRSVLFIPQGWYIPTEKTRIAQCIRPLLTSRKTPSRILYLVPPQQRKDAQVIEAAKLQIGSSFVYGSAPAFVYYVDKPVSFYYAPSKLYADWQNTKVDTFGAIVLDEADLFDPLMQEITSTWNTNTPGIPKCSFGSLRAFVRDN